MEKREGNIAMIPFVAHEAEATRAERANRRLWILCIILIFVLMATNIAWVIYELQFDTISVEQKNDTGDNSYIGNDGDIYNGNTEDNN